jgi:acetoin utilization deacetylase AcuC-like enzyme
VRDGPDSACRRALGGVLRGEALRQLEVERVFILDWDVHHGNGTVEAFRRRSDVLVAGIHQEGIFPGTGSAADLGSGPGEAYTINLPVPAGSEEGLWLSCLKDLILPAAESFGPRSAPRLARCWRGATSQRRPRNRSRRR